MESYIKWINEENDLSWDTETLHQMCQRHPSVRISCKTGGNAQHGPVPGGGTQMACELE